MTLTPAQQALHDAVYAALEVASDPDTDTKDHDLVSVVYWKKLDGSLQPVVWTMRVAPRHPEMTGEA